MTTTTTIKYRYTIHCTDQAGRRQIEVALPRPITGWRDLAVIEQHLRQRLGNTCLRVVSHTPHSTPQQQPGTGNGAASRDPSGVAGRRERRTDHSGQQHRERTTTGPRTGSTADPAAQSPATVPVRRGAESNRARPNHRTRARLRRIGNRLFLAGLVLALLAGNLLPAVLHVSPNYGGGVVFHVLAPAVFLAAGAYGMVRCHTWSTSWTTGRRHHRRDSQRGGPR